VTIEVKAREESISAAHRAGAQRVLEATEFKCFPDLKLLAFFDDNDAQCFMEAYGPDNRGVFFSAMVCTRKWPAYLTRLLSAHSPDLSLPECPECGDRRLYSYDGFIYLHGSTCDDPTALVMTFAHELQHFSQFGYHPSLWAENTLLRNLPGLNTSDIPIEREARIIAKRVAEELCGADIVHQYILRKIADCVTTEDFDDWQWIERLDSSTSYDLARETELAFQRQIDFKGELKKRLQERSNDPNFRDVDLSLYFQSMPK
jgi:hypothetical protein